MLLSCDSDYIFMQGKLLTSHTYEKDNETDSLQTSGCFGPRKEKKKKKEVKK